MTTHGSYALHAGYVRLEIHTLKFCNIHSFSTTTVVARTRLNVTLYIYGISCLKAMLEASANCQSRTVVSSKTDNEKVAEPSYKVGYRMTLAGEASTVAEYVRWKWQSVCLGEQSIKKVETVE